MRGACWIAPNAAPNAAAIITVVTIVVFLKRASNSSAKLGRFSVPASFFSRHVGDSGRKGRISMRGMAGMTPDISVYRHASCPPRIAGRCSP